MSDDLMPTLKRVNVDVGKLVLDPNNPRFLTQDDDYVDESRFLDPAVIEDAYRKMQDGNYRLKELEQSILENGWVPVDQIFVRKYGDTGSFVVLEGNRRVTAIRQILKREDLEPDLLAKINPLSVMLVVDDCDADLLKMRITYLLGVRHHGSLRPWTPFAQAKNMYERYLFLAKQDDDTYQWSDESGKHIADALSIDVKNVRERISVYRAMQQIDGVPEVHEAGGMKSRYYSLCGEVLTKRGKSALPQYIEQDEVTMRLTEESLKRIQNLCQFQIPASDRSEEAPVNAPPEWRKLDKILREEDEKRRKDMLKDVEVHHRHPSDVWAEREAELTIPRWETWLHEVSKLLAGVKFGDDLESEEARDAGQRLGVLLDELDKQTPNMDGELG